jgi:predicted restriction endonuclease
MQNLGSVTLSQVEKAIEDLGGKATWDKILVQVTKLRNGDYSSYSSRHIYENTAFQVIQRHCIGYRKYRDPSRFEKVGSTFRLTTLLPESTQVSPPLIEVQLTPVAIDIENPGQPERVKQETYRILRDTILARMVKESNQYRCQICGQVLKLKDDVPYAEAHHIMPLGAPHNGPDVRDNILCVCPNHHVLLDYGAIKLDETYLKNIGSKYINYHNENIFGKVLGS